MRDSIKSHYIKKKLKNRISPQSSNDFSFQKKNKNQQYNLLNQSDQNPEMDYNQQQSFIQNQRQLKKKNEDQLEKLSMLSYQNRASSSNQSSRFNLKKNKRQSEVYEECIQEEFQSPYQNINAANSMKINNRNKGYTDSKIKQGKVLTSSMHSLKELPLIGSINEKYQDRSHQNSIIHQINLNNANPRRHKRVNSIQNNNSPRNKSQVSSSEISRSTSLSHPFTSLSYVSSTTMGTSLTQKLERMNQVTVKTYIKTLLQCKYQIESVLSKYNLNFQSQLTFSEMLMILQETDVNLNTDQLSSILIAALLIQPKNDLIISFKQIISACQSYLESQDNEAKGLMNKQMMDNILDDIRERIQNEKVDLKREFVRLTECENDNFEKAIMTLDKFQKFLKQIMMDKYSNKEIELLYRNLVNTKNMKFKRFLKVFQQSRRDDTMKKQRSKTTLSVNGQLDRSMNRYEGDVQTALQRMRQVIMNNPEVTAEDILHKMKMKITDDPISHSQFNKSMLLVDPTLTQMQLRQLYDQLKDREDGKVRIPFLIQNLTGQFHVTVDFRKKMYKDIGIAIHAQNQMQKLRSYLEQADQRNNGKVSSIQLMNILKKLKLNINLLDIEKFIQYMEKDTHGLIDYQQFLIKIENPKHNNPLKSVGLRIMVFLKQNGLNPSQLLDKLVSAKVTSKNNQIQQKNSKEISVSFFSKFIKMKVDKKRSLEDIKQLIKQIDIDNDDIISLQDLESFLNRINFNEFYEFNKQQSQIELGNSRVINLDSKQQSATKQDARTSTGFSELQKYTERNLFPTQKLKQNKLADVLKQLKEDMKAKSISILGAFKILDSNQTGLISFGQFCQNMDQISQFSQIIKEKLFARMDTLKMGLISFEQFKETMNCNPYDEKNLEMLENQVQDSFQWEQEIIQKIQKWIIENNYSVQKAFKIIDQDFDGKISISDLRTFLLDVIKIDEKELILVRIERLYKLLDNSKTGSIYQSDFEQIFSELIYQKFKDQFMSTFNTSRGSFQSKNMKMSQISRRNQLKSKSQFQNKTFQGTDYEPPIAQSSFDWKSGALLQFKLFIDRQFQGNIDQCFRQIVSMSDTIDEDIIRIKDFQKYLQDNNILKGFNLTNILIQQLFTHIDPHKKGYLTLKDFQNAFNINQNRINDVISCVSQQFMSLDQAFEYFYLNSKLNPEIDTDQQSNKYKANITYLGFKKVLNQLMPNRFNDKTFRKLFTELFHVSQNETQINYEQFQKAFCQIDFKAVRDLENNVTQHLMKSWNNKSAQFNSGVKVNNLDTILQQNLTVLQKNRSSSMYNPYSNQDSRARSSMNSLDVLQQQMIQSSQLFDKLRRLLYNKNLDIMSIGVNGKSNIIEFRNFMKKLGINSREMDLILDATVQDKDGNIDLNLLISKLKRQDQDEALIDQRNKKRIEELRVLMYELMTSPEDAFRYFDMKKKGNLTYQDFSRLVDELYKQNTVENLTYPIIKDLFDQIDIKKDGIIDFTEWSRTFLMNKQKDNTQNLWVTKKEYKDLISLLVKNRKNLEIEIKNHLQKNNIQHIKFVDSIELVQKFIQRLLRIQEYEQWKVEELLNPFQELKGGEIVLGFENMIQVLKNRYKNNYSLPQKFQ